MITKLSDVTGNRPRVYNLKDSDQLKDAKLLVNKVQVHQEGEFGLFLVLTCKIEKNGVFEEEIIITTGAEDIVNRLLPLADRINGGMTIQATLTKLGRKWLID